MGMFLNLVSAQKNGAAEAMFRSYVENTRAEEKKTTSEFQRKVSRIEKLSLQTRA